MIVVSFTLCGVKRISEFVYSHSVQRYSSPSQQVKEVYISVSLHCRSVSMNWVKITTINGGFLGAVKVEVGVECCTVDKDHQFKMLLLSYPILSVRSFRRYLLLFVLDS